MFGIAEVSAIPVRAEADERSEMVTQVLFGESFTILEEQPKWFKIRIDTDGYEGWIDSKMATLLTEAQYRNIQQAEVFVTTQSVNVIQELNEEFPQMVYAASVFPNYNDHTHQFKIGENTYQWLNPDDEDEEIGFSETLQEKIGSVALSYINTPYLWGGKTHWGIDCSGFVQSVFNICGIRLPRDASQQALQGTTVNMIHEIEAGDLAFFGNEENITHVGILLDTDEIIHASGKVRIDRFDQQGIFDEKQDRYTHSLKVIKRIIQEK
jgi:cell wall-associated NlpC family hydrolase